MDLFVALNDTQWFYFQACVYVLHYLTKIHQASLVNLSPNVSKTIERLLRALSYRIDHVAA
jgi:hypothetical protein